MFFVYDNAVINTVVMSQSAREHVQLTLGTLSHSVAHQTAQHVNSMGKHAEKLSRSNKHRQTDRQTDSWYL